MADPALAPPITAARLRELGAAPTPLVRLQRVAPPQVEVWAKCEWHLPTGSVKDRVAAAMVARAEAEGRLHPGVRLLEASSGNTGIALARLARQIGIPLTVVVPDNVSPERVELLRAFGAEVRFTPGAEGSNGAVGRAERLAEEQGYLMLHQYANPANPQAHYLTTGSEIAAALDRVDAFVACLGTGGTLMGAGRALRERFPRVRVVAAEPPVGESIAGLRSLADGYVPPVFDPAGIDRRLLVRTRDAVAMTRRLLVEEGLFVGPSSGAAVHAALKVAAGLPAGAVLVTVLPDAGWKYLSTGIYRGDLTEAVAAVEHTTLW